MIANREVEVAARAIYETVVPRMPDDWEREPNRGVWFMCASAAIAAYEAEKGTKGQDPRLVPAKASAEARIQSPE